MTAFGKSVVDLIEIVAKGGLVVVQDVLFKDHIYVNYDAGYVYTLILLRMFPL